MGTLVVMAYPTKLFLNLADHTYVKCGTGGKAWGCWGGNTGGAQLRRADGSTSRADAIAGGNERGGIKCYLINGVCHQAANRILFPAGITVRGARGYDLLDRLPELIGDELRGRRSAGRAPDDLRTGANELRRLLYRASCRRSPSGQHARAPLRSGGSASSSRRGHP